jgi:hypothetical protein
MSQTLTVECQVEIRRLVKGRKQLRNATEAARPVMPPGRVPRVARWMALAIRSEQLLHEGQVASYAELARLGHVSRARVTQIMNLLNLAPDIQEDILFLPRTERGRDPVILRDLQPIAARVEWRNQRQMWQSSCAT